MGRESSMDQSYKIFAYLTSNELRKISGAPLFLKLKDEQELKETTEDIAKALKADIVKLKNNDYIVIGFQ
jgi:hypothetical protein